MPIGLRQMYGAMRGLLAPPPELPPVYSQPPAPPVFRLPGPMPTGMLEPGTLDLNSRPIIHNTDGSVSSEYSSSSGDDRGREVLYPTIVRGKFLTPTGLMPQEGSPEEKEMFRRAWEHYEQTGEHMGIFSNPDAADAYATEVHNRPIDYGAKTSRPISRISGQ